jgi:hypothetical protein
VVLWVPVVQDQMDIRRSGHAENRFNRFNLSFGIGYDFLRAVTDAYSLFAYPFFLSVPGYNVRAANLPDAERDRNLGTLRFISEQTARLGLQFQLGLWMHGYQWENSPHPNYAIEGLDAEVFVQQTGPQQSPPGEIRRETSPWRFCVRGNLLERLARLSKLARVKESRRDLVTPVRCEERIHVRRGRLGNLSGGS